MDPYYQYNPQGGDDTTEDEHKKSKVRALLAEMDDNALLRLGLMLQERGLLNLQGAQQQPIPQQLPVESHSAMQAMSWQGLANSSMIASASTVGALPVGPLPPGPVRSSFAPLGAMPNEFASPAIPPPPLTMAPGHIPPGNWNPSDIVNAESASSSAYNVEKSEHSFHRSEGRRYDGYTNADVDNGMMHEQDGGNSQDKDKLADDSSTTLILRNFPESFDQEKARQWVADRGYGGLYDFFLWFPAKASSRLNSCGYAFVNFRSAELAQKFQLENHMARFPATDGDDGEMMPLNVAVAKIQGFAKNYTRFSPMLEGNMHTMCTPFFAPDSVEALGQSETDLIAEAGDAKPVSPMLLENTEDATTIILRNLPDSLQSTEMAKQWLDSAGYASQYDFFLYLPAKKARQKGNPARGYAFVNFKQSKNAISCMQALQGKVEGDMDVPLNIVPAKIQGKTQCISHFASLADGGRCKPWLENAPPRTSFQ